MKAKLLTCLPLSFLLVLAAPAQRPAAAPPAAYRVAVTLRQPPGAGKPAGQTYVCSLRPGGSDRLESGDRIPIGTGDGKFTYDPVGNTFFCSLPANADQRAGQLEINLILTISSVVAARPNQPRGAPVFRNTSASVATIVPLGSAVEVAKFPDPVSHGFYQVEVLATRAQPVAGANPGGHPAP